VVPGKGIVRFKGVSISPIARVTASTYKKDGKWSKDTWTVEVQDDVLGVSYGQDWDTGEWFPVNTWSEAVKHFRKYIGIDDGFTDQMMVQTIRAIFPASAKRIDEAEQAYAAAGDQLQELLDAQEELAKASEEEASVLRVIAQLEEAEEMKAEAAAVSARTQKAKSLLSAGKMNLADLKAAMGR